MTSVDELLDKPAMVGCRSIDKSNMGKCSVCMY